MCPVVQDRRDGEESPEPYEELGLPGETTPVPPPRHPQVAGFQPPYIVVVARDKPGTVDGERERAREYLQAVSGGRRIPRLERADGDDVPVERAEIVTAGWHDENSRKYRAVSC